VKKKRKFSEGLLDEKKIKDELKIATGQTILDAGCGNGYMAKKFSPLVGKTGRIFALDSDKGFINILKEEVEGTNITALIGDITKSTIFQDRSVDMIYLSNVFHIFSKTQVEYFSKEANRILKPEGVLAIVNIKKIETVFGPPLEMRYSPEELIKNVKLHPSKLVDVGKYFYMQLFNKS